jgi:hypothetical protein
MRKRETSSPVCGRVHIDATRQRARCERCGEVIEGELAVLLRFARKHSGCKGETAPVVVEKDP